MRHACAMRFARPPRRSSWRQSSQLGAVNVAAHRSCRSWNRSWWAPDELPGPSAADSFWNLRPKDAKGHGKVLESLGKCWKVLEVGKSDGWSMMKYAEVCWSAVPTIQVLVVFSGSGPNVTQPRSEGMPQGWTRSHLRCQWHQDSECGSLHGSCWHWERRFPQPL